MRRKLILTTLVLMAILLLTGCDKIIDTKEIIEPVTITRSYYKPPIPITQTINGVTTTRIDPPIYRITVEYGGKEQYLFGNKVYNNYNKRLKEEVPAKIKLNKHESGKVSFKVIELDPRQ